MGDNKQTTTQNQSQTSAPYGAAMPEINALLQQIQGGGTTTAPQSAALGTLGAEANSVPNFGAPAASAVDNAFNAAGPGVGLLNKAYGTMSGTLAPYLQSDFTNPMNTPGFGAALDTLNEDITNQVNGTFAAAGRSGSGGLGGVPANADNTKALARGLSQGEGGLIANESNVLSGEQLNAANELLGGANTTATSTTNLPLAAMMAGVQGASAVPGLWTAPGTTQLQAADIAQQLPYQNLQLPLQETMLPAGAFPSGTSSGTSQTVQPINWLSTGAGLGLMGASMFGGGGPFGANGAFPLR